MDFSGTWKVYSEENLEEFMKVIGKETTPSEIRLTSCTIHMPEYTLQGHQRSS